MAFQTINSTNNKVVKTFEEMNDVAIDKIVANAVNTYDEWKMTVYKVIAQLLYKVAGLLRAKNCTY
jgi:acyl-CoA reductase-like NAD-dependent aldehyde dehydrogenase